jgi:hypothetical protein
MASCRAKTSTTASTPGVALRRHAAHNQYVPDGVKRGAAPECNESARFTSMLGGTVAGNILPAFIIIK